MQQLRKGRLVHVLPINQTQKSAVQLPGKKDGTTKSYAHIRLISSDFDSVALSWGNNNKYTSSSSCMFTRVEGFVAVQAELFRPPATISFQFRLENNGEGPDRTVRMQLTQYGTYSGWIGCACIPYRTSGCDFPLCAYTSCKALVTYHPWAKHSTSTLCASCSLTVHGLSRFCIATTCMHREILIMGFLFYRRGL